MGLFDLFKKKTNTTTFPDNELEKCLAKAATDSSARKEFYTKLLWADLIVLTNGQTQSDKSKRTLEKGSQVQLVQLQDGRLPVFTSTNRIFDKAVIKEQVPYMSMQGQNLFELTKGSTIVLNPFSDYVKELLPQEIDELLNGTIFNRLSPIILEKDTPLQIAQPLNYPTKLTLALADLFKTLPKVNAAYIALTRTGETDTNPHLLVGLDMTDGIVTEISKYAGPVAERHLEKGEILDFIQIENAGNDISEYFKNETKPFYTKD
jgi:hypothetical protein